MQNFHCYVCLSPSVFHRHRSHYLHNISLHLLPMWYTNTRLFFLKSETLNKGYLILSSPLFNSSFIFIKCIDSGDKRSISKLTTFILRRSSMHWHFNQLEGLVWYLESISQPMKTALLIICSLWHTNDHREISHHYLNGHSIALRQS